MSKKANPAVIGVFVIGAVALTVAAVLIIGGGQFFQERERYVTYFEGSVQGLRVGSNVLFRGVRIGFVTDIQLIADVSDPDNIQFLTPVTFETVPASIRFVSGGELLDEEEFDDTIETSDETGIDIMIKQGLRTTLEVESLLTGQLLIEVDMRPDTPAVFRGGERDEPPEIPSIPSNIQEAMRRVGKFLTDLQTETDIIALINNLHSAVDGLDRILNSDDTQALAGTARNALDELAATANSTRKFVDAADDKIVTALEDIGPVIEQLDKTLQAGEATLLVVKSQLEDDSVLAYQVNATLQQLEGAARSLRIFLEYLDQHPEALIKGRQEQ